MKRLNQLLLSCLFALFLFVSCQNEETQITQPNEEQTLIANSDLAMGISNTTSLDGSLDNILDGANCLTVGLPVTVTVNGIQIVIDSQEDYAVVEAIFDEFDDDDDSVEIQFPITIILSNYSEITIESYSELETFIEACAGENEYDDDIECIDFVYPFTISVYNANFQVTETVTITSDAMLYAFIESLDGGILASINFPISMVLADGSEVVINNNAELEAAINAADDTCDEDDDNDYNDDDNNDVPANEFIEILTNCTWIVDKLEIDDVDLEDQYVGFVFDFNVNGTVTVQNGNNTVSGTWAMVQVSTGIQISLQINDLPDFNNEHWILHEIEDGNEFKIDFRHGEDRLRFERFECDTQTDCTELDVDGYLQTCVWQIVNLDGSDALIVYQLEFNANQEVVITGNGMTINGGWSTSQSATGGVEVVFSNIAGPSIQAINGSWVIVDCMADRLEMEMGDHHMVMEINCDTDCDNPGFLANDLVVYMPFSNQALDLISGQEVANTTNDFVTDRAGNTTCAIAFNGNNNLTIPVTAQNQIVQGDSFSISVWFKMQNSNVGDLEVFFRKPGNATVGFQLGVYDLNTPLMFDNNTFSLWDNDWNQEVDVAWDNTDWHHLVVTVDSNNSVRLYRDGVLRNVEENSSLTIGSDPTNVYYLGEGFQGHLDDLRVYKRTLSNNEVSDLYNLEADCFECL